MKNKSLYFLSVFILASILSGRALANGGIPLTMIVWPFSIFSLLPIIMVEIFVFRGALAEVPLKRASHALTVSNLASTLIGFFVIYIPLFLIEYIAIMSAADGSAAPHSLIAFLMDGYFYLSAALTGVQTPYGCTKLLIFITITIVMLPFFLLSVWVEAKINFNFLKNQGLKYAQIKRITFQANAMSYLFLIIVTFISVIFFGAEESFYRLIHKLSFFS